MEFHQVDYAKEVRDSLARHPETTVFNCTGCGLEEIPAELLACQHLEELALGHNGLKELPADIGAWRSLRRLDLSYNDRLGWSPVLSGLANLEELSLNGCGVRAVPLPLEGLPKLKVLALGQNPLLPTALEGLMGLDSLKSLNIGYSNLYDVPEAIGALEELNQLDISSNGIQELPDFLWDLPLTSLDLTENKLPDLPEGLLRLYPDLKYLGLGANPLDAQAVEALKEQMPETEISFWTD